MNLEEMKEYLNESWNKSLMQITLLLMAVIILLELLVLGISYSGGRIDIPLGEYLSKEIILPSMPNLLMTLFVFMVYRCRSIGWVVRNKEVIMCYSLFAMIATVVISYRHFHVLWIAPCVCQYLHSVYVDRKGVVRIFVITNIFAIVTTVLSFRDKEYGWDYIAMTFVCVIGMLYVIYLLAKLLSGFHAEQLEYMQENYNRQVELIRELKIEPMTGLYNRNAMPEKIDHVIEENGKKNQESYLAMLDLDHFKRINDNYGHVSGDEVICHAAYLIKKHMNADIEGFRFGGEEFTLVFRNKTKGKALSILEQICREMEESIFDFDQKLSVTFSVGVAGYEPGMNGEAWIKKADEALYYSKQNGRNQIKMGN